MSFVLHPPVPSSLCVRRFALLLGLVAVQSLAAPADDDAPTAAGTTGFLAQWSGSLTGQFSTAKLSVGE
ncbi:MAG: hypothetical protein FJY36_08860, partial [Betaproteobacteria bacterium]|nr:hypothetical protein [Betaproteobacteria bacterium]